MSGTNIVSNSAGYASRPLYENFLCGAKPGEDHSAPLWLEKGNAGPNQGFPRGKKTTNAGGQTATQFLISRTLFRHLFTRCTRLIDYFQQVSRVAGNSLRWFSPGNRGYIPEIPRREWPTPRVPAVKSPTRVIWLQHRCVLHARQSSPRQPAVVNWNTMR